MKIAYLILAHNTPRHLERLIKALAVGDNDFYLHVDRKSSLADYGHLKGDRVFLAQERVPVHWGDFSQIRAIVALLRQALGSGADYDYCVLLSGSDYPLRSAGYINSFLELNQGGEFINMVRMPNEEVNKPLSRLTTYQVASHRFIAARMLGAARTVLNWLGLNLLERDYHKYLGRLEPHGGSEWWALTTGACRYILDFIDSERRVVRFFENTVCPDEMLFQTILGNSPFRDRVRRNLTYADWLSPGRKPAIIEAWHVDQFASCDGPVMADDAYGRGELLFARKFSEDSSELVFRIDSIIALKDR
jgi:core-2/I-Branching enzyme